jgi:hypothetical protein
MAATTVSTEITKEKGLAETPVSPFLSLGGDIPSAMHSATLSQLPTNLGRRLREFAP